VVESHELQGWITKFDVDKRMGLIEDSEYRRYIIEPGSFRRTTRLRIGNKVRFTSQNLYAGPTARDVQILAPEESHMRNNGLDRQVTSARG
jgi:hypothetical protein